MPISDTCIYLEAAAGDGGNHTVPQWWLSSDIQLSAPLSGPDKADPAPAANKVRVRVHQKTACTLPAEVGVVKIDVYVCVPTPSGPPPPNSANTTKISNAAGRPNVTVDPASLNPAGIFTEFDWTLKSTAAELPGHKCLVTRTYPDTDTPDPNTFGTPPFDQHVAQRNICIVPCESPCGLDLQVFTLNLEEPERVTLWATADLKPTRRVLAVVLPLLRQTKGFERLATSLPPPFAIELRDVPNVEVRDYTRERGKNLYGRRRNPNFALQLQLEPRHIVEGRFVTDLEGVKPGEAFIYHLTHVGPRRRVQNGLTVVMVRV
jgi:hypothetical protein